MFRKIKGQNKVIDILSRAIEEDKVANSYLFHGPEGVGKFTTALLFGMALNCASLKAKRPCGICPSCRKLLNFSHPDFVFIFPTPKLDMSLDGEIRSNKVLDEYKAYIQNKIETPWQEFHFSANVGIRIESIRMLEHRIKLSPNEASKKIYIIEKAELMTTQAANAFLKTLEEPPDDSIIILTSSKPNFLLPTILSRCQKIAFQPVGRKIIEQELEDKRFIDTVQAKVFSRIANGNMEKAFVLADADQNDSRNKALTFWEILLKRDDLGFIEFSGKYTSSQTQSELKEIISHIILWMSDINYFKYLKEEVVNLDRIDILEKIYQINPEADEIVSDMVENLEFMLQKLEGHVNPQLILINIFNKLSGKIFD